MSVSPLSFNKDLVEQRNIDEENLQALTKQTLQNRMFVGSFQEKRYVADLQAYRDIVVVSHDEIDLIRDLKMIKKHICDFYSYNHWIGITDPDTVGAPSGYCLWVELPENILGSYWYKVKRVNFKDNEVLLKLKVVRSVETNISNLNLKTLEISHAFTKQNLLNAATENLTWLFTTVVTLRNTKETLKFLSVLVVTIVASLIILMQYLGDFTLKFIREVSHFIQVLTPSIIAFINLCGKIVGGFYLLILSMWKTRSSHITYSPGTVVPNDMHNLYIRRALPPPPRSKAGIVITPLD